MMKKICYVLDVFNELTRLLMLLSGLGLMCFILYLQVVGIVHEVWGAEFWPHNIHRWGS